MAPNEVFRHFDVLGLGDLVVTFFLPSEHSEARWLEEETKPSSSERSGTC